MDPLKIHWQFALRAAIYHLEQLVYEFHIPFQDIERAGIKAYSDAPEPKDLMLIIDGFLEEHAMLSEGDIRRLKEMRLGLEKEIVLSYGLGRQKAQEEWSTQSDQKRSEMATMDFDEFRGLGKTFASVHNFSPSQAAWYVQAFSRQWREERTSYLKHSTSTL